MKKVKYFVLFSLLFLVNTTSVYANSIPLENGTYTISTNLNTEFVLDLKSGKVANKQNIQIYKENYTQAQQFVLQYLNNGYYKIASAKNKNYVLDVAGAKKTNGTNVQLYQYNGSFAQQWMLKNAGGGYYYLVSRCNGLYLDVKSGKVVNQGNIQVYKKNASKAQKFIFNKVEQGGKTIQSGLYRIVSSFDTKKAITRTGNPYLSSNRQNIELNTLSKSNNQIWYVKDLNNGYYTISSYTDLGFGFDVSGKGKTSGTNLQLYKYVGGRQQQWIIRKKGENSYNIISSYNGLYLDLKGVRYDDGTNIQLYKNNKNQQNQTFSFIKVEKMEPEKSIDSGYYMIMSNLNRKYVLEADTNNTTIKEVKNTSNQKWHILYTNDGYYTFAWAKDENYYLALKDGKITLSKKEKNKEFRWIIKKIQENKFYICSLDGKYIAPLNNTLSTANQAVVSTYRENNSIAFSIKKVAVAPSKQVVKDGVYTISSVINNQKNLDLAGGSTNNKTKIQLYNEAKNANQKWQIQYLDNGYYKISTIKNNSKVWDVDGYGDTASANVQLYDFTGNINQEWIIKEEEGYFYFISVCGEKYLSLANSSMNNATAIQVKDQNNQDTQKFILTEVKDTYTGIDASSYNGKVDWNAIKKSKVNFALLRLGYGGDFKNQDDSTFLYNTSECAKYKIPFGVYIYSYAENEKEAQEEYNHTIRVISSLPNNTKSYMKLPIFIDMEEDGFTKYGKDKLTKIADTYCTLITKKGYSCGVYANKNWLTKYLNASYLEKKYTIWLAHYTGPTTFSTANSKKTDYKGMYSLWQFTSKGKVNGINGNVDLNIGYNLF